MSNTESRQKFINKTKNIVSATILIMSVNDDVQNANSIRSRTIENALNLLDVSANIRSLTPIYKNQFISDIHNQIDILLDYLHVAYSVGVVSRMNVDILTRELRNLNEYLNIATNMTALGNQNAHVELPESFFADSLGLQPLGGLQNNFNQNINSINKPGLNKIDHETGFIKDNDQQVSFIKKPQINVKKPYVSNSEKRQNRKETILNFITEKGISGQNEGVMVKDILTRIKDVSEKTLQRELAALVAKGVLKKIGDKRWSRYVIR